MIDVGAIASSVAILAGIGAAVLVSAAAAVLHRRHRSVPTLTLLGGMVIFWVGHAIQLVAPSGEFSYVVENEEIVGATGTFSTIWYIGSIVFYVGLLLAATGLLMHALSSVGRRANDA